jgi:arylsulfatase A-like enzyme
MYQKLISFFKTSNQIALSLMLGSLIFIGIELFFLIAKKKVAISIAFLFVNATAFIAWICFFLLFAGIQQAFKWLSQQQSFIQHLSTKKAHVIVILGLILIPMIEWSSKFYLSGEAFQRIWLLAASAGLLIVLIFLALLGSISKRSNEANEANEASSLRLYLWFFWPLVYLVYLFWSERETLVHLSYPRWQHLILSFMGAIFGIYLISIWIKKTIQPENRKLKIAFSILLTLQMMTLLLVLILPKQWVFDRKLEMLSLANTCASCDLYFKKQASAMNQQQLNLGTCDTNFPAWPVTHLKSPDPNLPDIIFITVDALRWDHTSLSGYYRDTTPNLARLAKQAVVFENAFSPATSTRQSIKAIFTGVYSSLTNSPPAKRWALSLDSKQETLAHYLQSAGFYTTALVTAKGTFASQKRALYGFDQVDLSLHWAYKNLKYVAPYQVDQLIGLMSNPQRRPHFIWTHILDSHQPYALSPHSFKFGTSKNDLYDSVLYQIDENLKRVIDFVLSEERKHRTWLIISADHGQSLNEHQQGKHIHGFSTHAEEIHVPLIIYGPTTQGMRIKTPVQLIDLFPTLFEISGLETPKFSCGDSLMPFLDQKSDSANAMAKFQNRSLWVEQHSDSSRIERSAAFFWQNYKLNFSPTKKTIQLYDWQNDPKETKDLSAEKPQLFEEIKQKCITEMGHKKIDLQPYLSW